jgi:NAD(P)-dependent dehydrogenase (short-subunit alcohol dehydrogenase family)
MTLLLDGNVAVITGGTRGLGRAVAVRFAAAGATGLQLDVPSAIASADPVPGFTPIAADVADETSIATVFDAAIARFGRIDVVVANAGVVPGWSETESLDMETFDRVMAVNARGVVLTLKHAARTMRLTGGSIVVMASINAYVAHARQLVYTASKHAALGMVRASALDLGRYGIRVNALAPGPIATEALLGRIRARAETGQTEADALAGLAAQTALGRLATADEVAKAALFLASELASGITGEVLPVDAGLP